MVWKPRVELAKRAGELAREKHPDGYNKAQLIEASREVFGGWGQKVLSPTYTPLRTEEDVDHMRNAMALIDGRYPLGMTDCEVIGINGDCGMDCPVFRAGNCGEPGDLLAFVPDDGVLTTAEKLEILEMYGQTDGARLTDPAQAGGPGGGR